jgi:hypothetical protein
MNTDSDNRGAPQASASVDAATVELPPSWVRVTVVLALAITLLVAPLWVAFLLYQSGDLLLLAKAHPRAIIGVPWAGGAAFIVVLVLRTSFGDVKFKILETEFAGASGPIVMWVLCFLVEVLAIRLLW